MSEKASPQDAVLKAPATSTDVTPISRPDSPDSEAEKKLIQNYDSDPVLTKKVDLVNAAIDEIGMTPFQWKLFFLNGFGYGADTLLVLCQAVTQSAVTQEFGSPNKHIAGVYMASMVGLLVGAGLWGFSADIIGRKIAFNSSLFICALFVLIAGGMPSYISFSAMVAIYSAANGGNYILDTTNLVEFLPVSHTWLVTFMSIFWAVGYTITGLLAWAFLGNYSCAADATTPRWLISQNRDDEVYITLKFMADKYHRPLSLDVGQLQSLGVVRHTEKSVWSSTRLKKHFSGLFATRSLAYSTTLIMVNWFIIGIVSPLYTVFLPYYLASRGADTVELKTPVWQCLDVFWECKRNPDALNDAKVYIDCALKAAEALRYQWSRRFILCFLHCGTMMRILHFDRSGLMASEPIDITAKPAIFVRKDPDDGRRLQVVTVGKRQFFIDDQQQGPLRDHLVSRATTAFRAKLVKHDREEKTGWAWCYKSSWIQTHRRHEGSFLEDTQGPGVIDLLAYDTSKVRSSNDTTVSGRQQCASGDPMDIINTFGKQAKKQNADFVQHTGTSETKHAGLEEMLLDPRRPMLKSQQNCDDRERRNLVVAWAQSPFDKATATCDLQTHLLLWQQAFSAVKSIADKG
ncbi:hypothetical protein DV735_g5971, partial [Chaetothyriales sp. CBS 134920]